MCLAKSIIAKLHFFPNSLSIKWAFLPNISFQNNLNYCSKALSKSVK